MKINSINDIITIGTEIIEKGSREYDDQNRLADKLVCIIMYGWDGERNADTTIKNPYDHYYLPDPARNAVGTAILKYFDQPLTLKNDRGSFENYLHNAYNWMNNNGWIYGYTHDMDLWFLKKVVEILKKVVKIRKQLVCYAGGKDRKTE